MDFYNIYQGQLNDGKVKCSYLVWLEEHLETAMLVIRGLQPKLSNEDSKEAEEFLKDIK